MSAAKGTRPPNAGKGRKKGSVNKVTKTLKEMSLAALDKLGGVEYLVGVGKKHPVAFIAYLGRLIPTEVKGKLGITLEDLAASRGDHDPL